MLERELSTAEEEKGVYERRAKRAVEGLVRRGIVAPYAPDRGVALSLVMDMIPEGSSVGTADSVTLLQVGLFPALEKRNRNALINPFARDGEGRLLVEGEARHRLMREVFLADVYVAGTNAVTLDGKLVNTDGHGNRVAPMIYGPEKVIIVAGANKIVRDVEEAMSRIRNVCAPRNVIRHITKHQRTQYEALPCARTGFCADCTHPWKICNYTTIIEGVREPERGRINVVLVAECLGI